MKWKRIYLFDPASDKIEQPPMMMDDGLLWKSVSRKGQTAVTHRKREADRAGDASSTNHHRF